MSSTAEKLAKKSSRPAQAKQVRLRLVYLDFWSIMKISFLTSLILAIVLIVATFLIWSLLTQTGVLLKISELFSDIAGNEAVDVNSFASLGQVMGFTVIVAILNVVAFTALGSVGAILYNLSVSLTGGVLLGFTNK